MLIAIDYGLIARMQLRMHLRTSNNENERKRQSKREREREWNKQPSEKKDAEERIKGRADEKARESESPERKSMHSAQATDSHTSGCPVFSLAPCASACLLNLYCLQ